MLPEKYSKDRYYGTRDNTPLSKNDIDLWPDTSDPSLYAQKIIPIAEENRRKSRELQEQNAKRQLTYRNKSELKNLSKLDKLSSKNSSN